MKRKLRLMAGILAACMLFPACGGTEQELDFDGRATEIDLCNYVVRAYLDADDYDTEFQTLKTMQRMAMDRQEAEITVRVPQDTSAPYSFVFSSDREFTKFTTYEMEITGRPDAEGYIGDYFYVDESLIPGNEYFWKVLDKKGKIADYGKTCVKDAPVRFINVESVRNFRDIGGWTAENGKKVAYGLVYRGTRLNGQQNGTMLLTEKGRARIRDELGIMTEIDLRSESDSTGYDQKVQITCVFGDIVNGKNDRNYLKCDINQYDAVINSSRNYALLRQIFSYFADESKYPIYFHCNSGADRTGTIAFLLNGLLGVSFEDLTRDFELTSMYSARWRSKATSEGFDGEGANKSGLYQQDGGNYVNWGKLYTDVMEFSEDGTLADGIANFLKERVGITDEQIASIKSILLK